MMTGNKIRKDFLAYFAERGHTVVESSPLVPHDDPTLLFTNAGMVQFKRLFMGEEKREYVRAVTSQRCVRAGGKHNDLENVGYTARHHTFFEMLGNFSFGDYFKDQAIGYAWEFLTGVIGLPMDKLWVSVYEKDDEAFSLWEKVKGLPKGRIIRLGEKDNFWAMGDTGPCGPCSEILIDQGPGVGCGRPECRAGCDCDRYLELWNLVFMQFYRDESGRMSPLPKPSIDTGMGLERIAAVLQGKVNNFDSDLFSGLVGGIAEIAGRPYGNDPQIDTAFRVIADHCRAITFLVADGVLPANEGRGYVLRRIIRRAVRYGRTLGLKRPFLTDITSSVAAQMSDAYPHLQAAEKLLARVVVNEEERFLETLGKGLEILSGEIKRHKTGAGDGVVPGTFIFKLYDTYGFPVDIVRDVAHEEGLEIDESGFKDAMDIQRQQSKKSWKGEGLRETPAGLLDLVGEGLKTEFSGYETRSLSTVVGGIVNDAGISVARAVAGETVIIVFPRTPFYAAAGGQVGDRGDIIGSAGRARVLDTASTPEGLIIHKAEIETGEMTRGMEVNLRVSEGRRQRIANNHTATHLLQAALKSVLGDHVNQSGSLVEPDRLRFDFTHFSPLSAEELQEVENLVNREIRADIPLHTDLKSREEAQKSGATALFGEKYGETVRVVSVGSFSKELCGGTHVGATGEIGVFKIISESGIAAGVRRIEAVTGHTALLRFQAAENRLAGLAEILKTSPAALEDRVKKLLIRQKELEKKITEINTRMTFADLDVMVGEARTINGVRVLSRLIPLESPKHLREAGDRVRDRLGSGIAVLGGVCQNKAVLLVMVSKDLTGRFHAGRIIKDVAAKVGGTGGGRPDMAQAGGGMTDKLPEALDSVYDYIEHAQAL